MVDHSDAPTRTSRDEIDAHLALETDRLIDDGLSPDEARDAARRAFGNAARRRRSASTRRTRWVWLEQLAQDLRYAVRGLSAQPARSPRPRSLTLAVGLGLVTVVFADLQRLRAAAVRGPRSATACTSSSGARRTRSAAASAGATTRSCAAGTTSSSDVIAETHAHVTSQRAAARGGVRLGQLLRRRSARASGWAARWPASTPARRAAARSRC